MSRITEWASVVRPPAAGRSARDNSELTC